jgi:hypothetical protein
MSRQVTILAKDVVSRYWPMSSERDSFAKGIFSTFAKGFLLHKVLLEVNFSPLRVKKSRSHDMGHWYIEKSTYAVLYARYSRDDP